MTDKKPSRLFSFRVPADVADELELAIRISGKDKTTWMLAAVLERLGKSVESLSAESRIEVLIGQMEILVGKVATAPLCVPAPARTLEGTTAPTARDVIAQMVEESKRRSIQSSNKAIASKLNELGIKPARGLNWTMSAVDNLKRRMHRN